MTVVLKVRFPVDDAALSLFHQLAFSPDRPDTEAVIRPWADRLDRHSLTWIGAFSEGQLVGFVHAVWDGGTHAFILDTAVHPDFQRLGIGRDLVRAVTDEAFKAGCDWVHVDYEPQLLRERLWVPANARRAPRRPVTSAAAEPVGYASDTARPGSGCRAGALAACKVLLPVSRGGLCSSVSAGGLVAQSIACRT